jgi:hypothetical protein
MEVVIALILGHSLSVIIILIWEVLVLLVQNCFALSSWSRIIKLILLLHIIIVARVLKLLMIIVQMKWWHDGLLGAN